eukprot:Polyplicarium_translucidae@DN5523_c0_g1_i1.p2
MSASCHIYVHHHHLHVQLPPRAIDVELASVERKTEEGVYVRVEVGDSSPVEAARLQRESEAFVERLLAGAGDGIVPGEGKWERACCCCCPRHTAAHEQRGVQSDTVPPLPPPPPPQ